MIFPTSLLSRKNKATVNKSTVKWFQSPYKKRNLSCHNSFEKLRLLNYLKNLNKDPTKIAGPSK